MIILELPIDTIAISSFEKMLLEVIWKMFEFIDIGKIIDVCQAIPSIRRQVIEDTIYGGSLHGRD